MTLTNFTYNSKNYYINITNHAQKRLKDRCINLKDLWNTINKIKLSDLFSAAELMIRDIKKKISIVIAVNNNSIIIITVIDKIAECDNYKKTKKLNIY